MAIGMNANFGGYQPSQYMVQDNTLSRVGDRFANAAASIPSLVRQGQQWGDEMDKRNANEQLKALLYERTNQLFKKVGLTDVQVPMYQKGTPAAEYGLEITNLMHSVVKNPDGSIDPIKLKILETGSIEIGRMTSGLQEAFDANKVGTMLGGDAAGMGGQAQQPQPQQPQHIPTTPLDTGAGAEVPQPALPLGLARPPDQWVALGTDFSLDNAAGQFGDIQRSMADSVAAEATRPTAVSDVDSGNAMKYLQEGTLGAVPEPMPPTLPGVPLPPPPAAEQPNHFSYLDKYEEIVDSMGKHGGIPVNKWLELKGKISERKHESQLVAAEKAAKEAAKAEADRIAANKEAATKIWEAQKTNNIIDKATGQKVTGLNWEELLENPGAYSVGDRLPKQWNPNSRGRQDPKNTNPFTAELLAEKDNLDSARRAKSPSDVKERRFKVATLEAAQEVWRESGGTISEKDAYAHAKPIAQVKIDEEDASVAAKNIINSNNAVTLEQIEARTQGKSEAYKRKLIRLLMAAGKIKK